MQSLQYIARRRREGSDADYMPNSYLDLERHPVWHQSTLITEGSILILKPLCIYLLIAGVKLPLGLPNVFHSALPASAIAAAPQ
ncbi:hypothetical protein EON65_43925 [archaeon]|nr:MAG: hypothetical protein EON65_43925 [archaeon]